MKIRPIAHGRKGSNDLPEMYKESKLFSRKHPASKSVEEVPDPQLEDIEPEDDRRPVDSMAKVDKSAEATQLLKSFLSKAEPTPEQPDMTGKLEGKFKVSVEEMITWLNKIISAEYSEWMRWYHYALVLKGHAREALVPEFEKHAEDELEHIDKIALRVIALGGYPATTMVHPKPLTKREDILKELIYREQEGIKLYRQVLDLCGDNTGTRVVIEANVEAEQEHLDELWRWLKGGEMEKGTPANPTADDHRSSMQTMQFIAGRAQKLAAEHKDQWNLEGHGKAASVADAAKHAHGLHQAAIDNPSRENTNAAYTAAGRAHTLHNELFKSLSKADMSSGRDTMKPEKQKMAEYDHSFARHPEGESGQPTPDLPDRGKDWHGTVPGVKDEPQDKLDDDDDDDKPEYFRDPKDFLAGKSVAQDNTDEAIKALSGAARFSPGPFVPPQEKEFMLQNGYTQEEIDAGAQLTPRLRAEYNRTAAQAVAKSLLAFTPGGRR